MTTTFVPIGANSHRAMASSRHWRTHPADVGVPSSFLVCSGLPALSTGTVWKPIGAVKPVAKRTKYSMEPL